MEALDGQVAIVTGGAKGIGRAIADRLAADGARIVIADLQGAEEAAGAYADGVGLAVDVADEQAVERMAADVADRCGRIDILVNNAGLYASLQMRPFEQIPVDEWRQVMDVNVLSMFLTCRAVVPRMREAGGGRIVNIGAIQGRAPDPAFFATSVNRAAGNSFTKTLAMEVAKDGILVTGVNVGYVITPQWDNIHRRRAPEL